MVKRNIAISYFLAFSKNTWFWLGIWIFYYLRFTDYAGIGIIETVMIVTLTFAEIPTGAIADLVGKKKTLILAFLLEAVGGFIFAFNPNLQKAILAVFIMCLGGAFYSGTIDALVFDTLKQEGKDDSYSKKLANMRTIALISWAVCGVVGGFMYKISPPFPYYANALGYLLGFVASFFLIEPSIDTVKFNSVNFMRQMKQGISELFKNSEIKNQTILLLSVGFVVIIFWEMLDGFLGYEFGFKEIQLGILWSAIFIISALASQLTPFISSKFPSRLSMIIIGVLIAITLMISPALGIVLGGVSIAIRASLQGIYENMASIAINQSTESRFRATTISAFNMIKNVPYVLTAYFIGSISDKFSAKTTAFYLGIALLFLIFLQVSRASKKRYN